MRFLKATFLIRLNRVVVKGQKTLENKEGDSSPSAQNDRKDIHNDRKMLGCCLYLSL